MSSPWYLIFLLALLKCHWESVLHANINSMQINHFKLMLDFIIIAIIIFCVLWHWVSAPCHFTVFHFKITIWKICTRIRIQKTRKLERLERQKTRKQLQNTYSFSKNISLPNIVLLNWTWLFLNSQFFY